MTNLEKKVRPIRLRVIANTGEVAMMLSTNDKMLLVHRGTTIGYTDCFRDEFLNHFVVGAELWGATDGEEFRYDPDTTTTLEKKSLERECAG